MQVTSINSGYNIGVKIFGHTGYFKLRSVKNVSYNIISGHYF